MNPKEKADVPRALRQWDSIAHILEGFGVEIFEIPPMKGCQDQIYTANIATDIKGTIVLANFSSPGRSCEVEPARQFFTKLGYRCIQPPFAQEAEADLKKWKDGVYFGGWGISSNKESYPWIEQQTGVKIITVHEVDEGLFHLDCSLLVVDENNFLITKKGLDPESVKVIQKCGNVIFTPEGIETTGITNGILIPEKRIYISGCFQQEDKDYRQGSEWLMETMDRFGYTVVFVDCDSYNISGADCSCTAMRLEENPPSLQAST